MNWMEKLQEEGGISVSEKTDTSTTRRPILLPRSSSDGDEPVQPAKARKWPLIVASAAGVVVVVGVSLFVGSKLGTTSSTSETTSASAVASSTSLPQAQKKKPAVKASDPAVAGKGCKDSDKPVISPGQKSLREAWVAFSTELYAHNASGVESVLTEDSSMRGQNWEHVFTQLGEADFCLSMEAEEQDTVRGQLTVSKEGTTTAYAQVVTGTEKDGKWLIKEIRKAS